MRINASHIGNVFPEKNSNSQFQQNVISVNREHDSFQASRLGSSLAGKLRVSGDFSITDSLDGSDPTLKLMNHSIKEVGKLLEEMKTLAELAQSEDLSDEDRIDMQIQMTKLQAQLYKKTYGMSMEIASQQGDLFNSNQLNAIDYDEKLTLKMLERERTRIQNGGEVNMEDGLLVEDRVQLKIDKEPEAWGLTEIVYDEASGEYVPGKAKEDLGDGTYAMSGFKAKKLIESGSVMTDEERMAKNTLSLMDVESAKNSTKKIENQIKGLVDMQVQLRETVEKQNTVSIGPGNPEPFFDNTMAKNSVMTSLGMMKATQDKYGENPLKGRDLDSVDVRLVDANGPIGSSFQKLDAFFKDKIHKTLGLAGLWDSQQNITFA